MDINEQMQAFYAAHEKNAIFLRESDRASGRTHFGGDPLLPPDFVWPEYTGKDFHGQVRTNPLSFLLQVDCAAIHALDKDGLLPDHGILSFFYELDLMQWGYDPSHDGCAQVFYFENPDELTETAPPETLEPCFRVPQIYAEAAAFPDVPDACEGFAFYGLGEIFGDDEDEYWDNFYNDRTEAYPATVRTKLLGYADLIQDEFLTDCESVSRGFSYGNGRPEMTQEEEADIHLHAQDWILLLQMDSLETRDYRLDFGGDGRIYFCIRKEDLAARRFDRVHLILQCS